MQVNDAMVAKAAQSDTEFDGRTWLAMPKSERERYMERSRRSLTAALAEMWRPIEELTDEQNENRILVAGWQKPNGRTAGYWWWHEDTVVDGRPFEHPEAQFWCLAHYALPLPPPMGRG